MKINPKYFASHSISCNHRIRSDFHSETSFLITLPYFDALSFARTRKRSLSPQYIAIPHLVTATQSRAKVNPKSCNHFEK